MFYLDSVFRSHSLWHLTVFVTEMSLIPFQQIKKVPVGFVRGFQSLRPQLKTLICTKSLISLNVSSLHSLLNLFLLQCTKHVYRIKLVILSAKKAHTCYFLANLALFCSTKATLCPISSTISTVYFSHSFSSDVSAFLLTIDLLVSHQFFHVQYNCSHSLCWVYGQTSFCYTKAFVKDVINTHDGRV